MDHATAAAGSGAATAGISANTGPRARSGTLTGACGELSRGAAALRVVAMKVIGYKWLHVDTSVKQPMRLALVSAHDAREWVRGPNRANYVPSHDYLWGFNAYHSASRARWSGRKFGTVMVGVVGFGTVALFQRGWRAETAEIVAIYTPRRFWRHIDTVARSVFIERLRATYDVPVFGSLSELRRETERWGVPARTFLRRGEYRQATADVNQRSD